jgi:hypothetical protein
MMTFSQVLPLLQYIFLWLKTQGDIQRSSLPLHSLCYYMPQPWVQILAQQFVSDVTAMWHWESYLVSLCLALSSPSGGNNCCQDLL